MRSWARTVYSLMWILLDGMKLLIRITLAEYILLARKLVVLTRNGILLMTELTFAGLVKTGATECELAHPNLCYVT